MSQPPIQTYLTAHGGLDAVAWYEKTWDAKQEMLQMAEDGKRILHTTLAIFDGHVMLSDEFPEFEKYVTAPPSNDGTSVTVHVNFPSREALNKAAKTAKDSDANITMPADVMPWGAYYARLIDPFGHSWSFAAE